MSESNRYGPAFTSLNFLRCAYPMTLLREKSYASNIPQIIKLSGLQTPYSVAGSLPWLSTVPALTCFALRSSYLDVQDGLSHPSGSRPGRLASAPPGSPPRAPAAATALGTADTCDQSTAQLVRTHTCVDGSAGDSLETDCAKGRNTIFCCCLNSYCSDLRV